MGLTVAVIIVVDDDDSVRKVLKNILQRQGHDVHEASDGDSALSQCRGSRPDLAFIDM